MEEPHGAGIYFLLSSEFSSKDSSLNTEGESPLTRQSSPLYSQVINVPSEEYTSTESRLLPKLFPSVLATTNPNPNLSSSSPTLINNKGVSETLRLKLFPHLKMEHMLAGVSGGVVSTLLLHPLDLVKIRFAVNDGLSSRPKYDGLFHAFKSILKNEGYKGLYRGVTPNVWGAGSAWGLYFLFYNSLKSWWQGGDSKTDLGPTKHMIIAAEAGFLTLMFTNPIWVVKTRLCLQYGTGVPAGTAAIAGAPGVVPTYYSGMTDALVKVYRNEGIKGLYRGMVPGMFGVSHGAIQFMCYEEMKTSYNKYRNKSIDAKLGTMEYLSFAAVSKLIAAGTTYPYQVVRARLQDQHRVYEGVMDVIRQTYRNEGFRGFWKGLIPNLIRVVPATAITFVVYEKTSSYLSSFRKPIASMSPASNSISQEKVG